MLQQIIQLVTILFLLSMVCERIADFLKHYLSDKYLFKIQKNFFKIGDTLTKFPKGDEKEQERVFRILKINVASGIFLATFMNADLIQMLHNIENPSKTLGWGMEDWDVIKSWEWYEYFLRPLRFIIGVTLTGCFISFGSKFWHDLLDILYQIKNTKRVLADPETYKVDNTKTLQKLFDTYQSDFVKAAYHEARTKYMAMDSVKAIGIKSNDLGYYFEITVDRNNPDIEPFHQYLLDDGTPQNIPIKIVGLDEGDKIVAHSLDLSAKVFDKDKYDIEQDEDWGTLGVIVKPLDNNSNKRYLLTCCHNVIPFGEDFEKVSPITAGTIDESKVKDIGTVFKAKIDYQMDAALIEIDTNKINVRNYIPNNGNLNTVKKLVDADRNNLKVYLYGANSGAREGIITSLFSSPKITYNVSDEFVITDIIAVSNNGNSLTQGGDSGACVVDGSRNVVGLVVGGNSKTTYVMPIQTLLTKLNVQLA